MGVGGERQSPAALRPGQRPGTRCTGDWVDSGALLDGCGPDLSARSPTALSRPAAASSSRAKFVLER